MTLLQYYLIIITKIDKIYYVLISDLMLDLTMDVPKIVYINVTAQNEND